MLIRLNVVAGGLIGALLIASLLARVSVLTALGVRPIPEDGWVIAGMRAIMALGIATSASMHVVFWTVIGLELIHLMVVVIASRISSAGTQLDIRWSLNITRWLVVLLLFVVANVFEHGAGMREELEGTV